MKGKWNIVLAGMAGALAMGMPVMAEEFVTADQVLKLQTPDKEWKQVEDQDTWVTLAKGNDRIAILHLSNGEQLPSVAVADDTFARALFPQRTKCLSSPDLWRQKRILPLCRTQWRVWKS